MASTCWLSVNKLKHLSFSRQLFDSYKFLRPQWTNKLMPRNVSTIQSLKERGLIIEHFPDKVDINSLLGKKRTIYAGFDATADSLQIGNLLVLLALLHLRKDGHRIIALIGDATARIGDPTGRTHDRPAIEKGVTRINGKFIALEIKRIFENHENIFCKNVNKNKLGEYLILNNDSWYKNMNVIDFLSSTCRWLRVGDMLYKSSVKERLESTGLSFCEFSYQMFQAYDWYHLFTNHGCDVQVGGIDQCINIHHGHDLIRKLADKNSYALYLPLVIDAQGKKLGKSEATAIWLNPQKTSPYSFYQFFIRLLDTEIHRYFKLFSFCSDEEIERLFQKQMKAQEARYLQRKLAEEVTLLIHGEAGLASAKKTSEALFGQDIHKLGELSQAEVLEALEGAPISSLIFDSDEMTVLNLAMKSKCFKDEREALVVIKSGGFYLNNAKVTVPSQVLTEDVILPNDMTFVRIGKKNYHIIKWH